METTKLKKFAQFARRSLIKQVSAKLERVLAENSPARRESAAAISKLEHAINDHGRDQVIDRVAYIWFNRFCALRFMDVNRYNRIAVVSPAEGQFQPEILAEAKMGHIDEGMVHDKTRQQIFDLLDGKTPSQDPQSEAYRLLVVAICNHWNKAMPFLFERIDDYTELLMPDDLLSGNSTLAYTREAMTPDACKDVEVIGWLYQFYISEKKDEVFDGLKKNKKITPENIPAATQLFTPHWIVRYLVENSLGRLWLLNRPGSKLVGQMDYYIKPEQPETDFLKIKSPEEIKICDPACGSGHMLTYAFDLLYAIYEEEGYEPAEIPEKILTHNLFGIEIDERAGELAAFALTMKARAKQRRFFNKGVKPNICVLENVQFDEGELGAVISHQLSEVSKETRTAFISDMQAFEEAGNFGSLIRPTMTLEQIAETESIITDYDKLTTDLFESTTLNKVLQALQQASYLSPKYHVVIANPPYMGGKGMNGRLGAWAKDNFQDSKSDLFAMFMERNLGLAQKHGAVAMITMQSWMFLSSFEALRAKLLGQSTLLSMAHLGARAFDSIGGEVVSTTSFVLENSNRLDYKGGYLRLIDGKSETEKNEAIREAVKSPDCGWFFRSSAADFKKIPGSPIAYWVSKDVIRAFDECETLNNVIEMRKGLATSDNGRFLREWHECEFNKIGFNLSSRAESEKSGKKWFPIHKGGPFRKWYGNHENIINWENDGYEIRNFYDDDGKLRSRPQNLEYSFKQALTWSKITSGNFTARYCSGGFLFDDAGAIGHSKNANLLKAILPILSSKIGNRFLEIINPTLNYQIGDVGRLPLINTTKLDYSVTQQVSNCIAISSIDWDAYETSWDFTSLPLMKVASGQWPVTSEEASTRTPVTKLSKAYAKLKSHWWEMTLEMQRLEEENNRIFIEAYGLQDELTPEVPLNEITLTCNPHYRYGNDKSEDELEALLLADTLRELVSYAVGCMFGRYALDKPGLILANQGETIEDYLKQIPKPVFQADDDNVIPMLGGDWFTDDITERFREFLRVTFGEKHYEENLQFVEQGLNIKGKRNYSIRDYFLKEFYTDHVKRYKKRPIYWLFSSPKGSFNALIYMHRYRPDTASVVLNDYLREFRTKLTAHKNHLEAVSISGSASQKEKTQALKEIEKINKMISELEDYEREVLYPLATEQVEVDLDDGVKKNYPMFGKALKKVSGLS